MANLNPKRAELLTIEQLKAFAHEVDAISGSIRSAMEFASSSDTKAICAYNYASGMAGITRLKTFSAALDSAVFLARNGKPLKPGDLKPRSVATKKKPNRKRD